jgi:hypothetical protein
MKQETTTTTTPGTAVDPETHSVSFDIKTEPATNNISNITTTTVTPMIGSPPPALPSSSMMEVDLEGIHDDASASLAFGYSPALLEALYKKVLIGFGKNALGRFSLAALYDEATNEFRCEKKYMTVKFAVKRGRRSHAEYALNYASNPAGSTSTIPPVQEKGITMTRKNSLSSLNDSGLTTTTGGGEGILPSRNRSTKLSQYLIDEETNLGYDQQNNMNSSAGGGGAATSGNVNPQKRKRSGSMKQKGEFSFQKAVFFIIVFYFCSIVCS